MTGVADFPLFALGIAVLPTELVPLHIFEPRYKAMIEQCLDSESEFGIVFSEPDAADADLGCAVEIAEVLERMDDGRLNIVCRGTRPLRVVTRSNALEYPAGEVEFLDDSPEEPDAGSGAEARRQFAELVERATDLAPLGDELGAMSAYAMAARVDFSVDAKQGLLALRSENARLRLLSKLLRAVNKRLDQDELVAQRARMNGKVRFD